MVTVNNTLFLTILYLHWQKIAGKRFFLKQYCIDICEFDNECSSETHITDQNIDYNHQKSASSIPHEIQDKVNAESIDSMETNDPTEPKDTFENMTTEEVKRMIEESENKKKKNT